MVFNGILAVKTGNVDEVEKADLHSTIVLSFDLTRRTKIKIVRKVKLVICTYIMSNYFISCE